MKPEAEKKSMTGKKSETTELNSGQAIAQKSQNWFWGLPWWARILGIYTVTRIISGIILTAAGRQQGPGPWGFNTKGQDYWKFINIWDAGWYEEIFSQGYPQELPRELDGSVKSSAWAFYPVFPYLVRALSFGGGWMPTAALVSVAAGAGASLMIYKIFREVTDSRTATWGVSLVFVFPAAAIFQVPYAEALNLLLLATALFFTMRRQYFFAIPAIILSDLSRPVGPAFACFAVLHVLSRFLMLKDQRRVDGEAKAPGHGPGAASSPVGAYFLNWITEITSKRLAWRKPIPQGVDLIGVLCFLAVSLFSAVLWPFIAWQVTGTPDAYTKTEAVWRGGPLVLFKSWLDTADYLFGPIFGPIALAILLVMFVMVMFSDPVKKIGLDLRLWVGSYALYLLAVFHPQTSTFRLLIPMFPLALGAIFVSKSKAYRTLLIIASIGFQVVWVVWLWVWQQLPPEFGGGDYPP